MSAPVITFGSVTVVCSCGSIFTVGPNIPTSSHHSCHECGRLYIPTCAYSPVPDDGEPRQPCGHDRDADCRCEA